MTAAHEQAVEIRFIERWPAHEPREQDPHYHLFNEAKRRLKRQGLLKCQVESAYHWGHIELHHSKVEYAHIGDVDLEKFNHAYGLHLSDEEFQEYVEQEGNLEPLCVTGESRVLMASGRRRRIDRVRPGDEVVCHHGHAHHVSAVMDREVDEAVYHVGCARLTAEHPVSTEDGFVAAGELAIGQVVQQLGVLVPYVLRMRSIKHEILGAIVALVVVPVVNAFLRLKTAAKHLLHDVAVFKHLSPLVAVPHMQPDVPLRCDLTAPEMFAGTGQRVERRQATVVRAETRPLSAVGAPALNFEMRTAGLAGDSHALLPANGRALFGARGVSVGKVRGDDERPTTRHARFLDAAASFTVWRPIHRLRVSRHRGRVYNLDVTGCHSYIVGGVAVHNCTLHHRGQEGVHSLPEPQWGVLRTAKDPEHVLLAVRNTEIGVQKIPKET